MQTDERNDVAELRIKTVNDDSIVLLIPETEYELHLVLDGDVPEAHSKPGKRIQGTLHARALRMHRSDRGGRFIEPVYGTPRIVQGSVTEVDEADNRLLMDMAVPIRVTLNDRDNAADFQPGMMLNCYLESGTSFRPR